MKKTLFTLVALAGIVQADDMPAFVVQDGDFTTSLTNSTAVSLDEIIETFNTGTFAISFDLSSVLATDDTQNTFNFKFNYGGNGNSLTFSYMTLPTYSVLTTPGNDLSSSYIMLEAPINAESLLVQVDDFFGSTPTVTLLGYTKGQELETIWSGDIPSIPTTTIETANLSLHGTGELVTPLTGISLTIWQGHVTAADMANPTPAPAPSPTVPEPATATLSLLALAGLAARRRRR